MLDGVLAAAVLLQARANLPDTPDVVRPHRGVHLAASLLEPGEGLDLGFLNVEVDDLLDTRITSVALPFRTVLGDEDSGGARPVVEAGASAARADGRTSDLFEGDRPGQELGVDTAWVSYGVQGGGGLEWDLGSGFRVSPVLHLGIQHVENRVHYAGPGEATFPPVFDGRLFDWQATVLSYGGSLRLEWSATVGEGLRWKTRLRYDGWAYETLQSTDDDQENPDPAHVLRLRNELSGPFDFTLFDRPLGWTVMLGYKQGLGEIAESLGYDGYFEIAGTLRIGVPAGIPGAGEIRVTGSGIWGADVVGWSAGVSLAF